MLLLLKVWVADLSQCEPLMEPSASLMLEICVFHTMLPLKKTIPSPHLDTIQVGKQVRSNDGGKFVLAELTEPRALYTALYGQFKEFSTAFFSTHNLSFMGHFGV